MQTIQILKVVFLVVALLIAVVGHEIMHGLMAYGYGDDTAKKNGRLSLNPLKHIDLIGTVIVPALLLIANAPFLIGWAKPVPIDGYKVLQKSGYLVMVNVSLAGIFYNFSVAFIASVLFHLTQEPLLQLFLFYLTLYNIILAMFNLLPIPPLDGANAIGYLFLYFKKRGPYLFFQKIERFGMVILVLFLLSPLAGWYFFIATTIIKGLLLE